jgi:NAD(P)-dependent dehydrogenase (short-subunit alcohol dehydrogenase family)
VSGAILLVGAGPGIGLAAAERFGREDWTVVLAARTPRHLDPMVARLIGEGIDAHGVVLDATDPVAVRAAVRTADRLTGGLTTVLYNAATVRQQDLFSMTDAEVSGDVAVNITGGLNTIRAAEQVFADRGGTILVTGGGLAVHPHASWASLGLGKAALRNVVEGLAPDLAGRGIRIAIATVATLVAPDSADAQGVAKTLWSLATQPEAGWERTYPPVSLGQAA